MAGVFCAEYILAFYMEEKMKKVRVLFVVSLFVVLGACSLGNKKSNELVINSYFSDEIPKVAFERLVDGFKQQNPEIEVTINTSAHEQFKTLLPSWLTSSQAPDVVTWFAGYRMQTFAKRGLLEPLNDIFPGGSFEKEFPASFKGSASYKGNVYFLPQSWYWWAVYYNKQIFAKYNLNIPRTWDEFLQVCDVLKANNISPIAIGTKETWTAGGWFDYVDSAVNGGDFHQQLTLGEIAYTDPRVKETFKTIANLAQSDYFIPNASSYSWQEAAGFMIRGEAAMYLMGQFILDVVPAEVQSNIDFFPFPIYGNNTEYAVDTPTDGFMLPAKAKNKENAKKFMKYLATKEAQGSFCNELGRLAANVNVTPANAIAKKGLDMVLGAGSAAQFYDRDAPEEMAAKGMNAIVEIMQAPEKLDSILEELDKERIRIYEK